MNKLKKSLAFVSALTMMATATPVLGTVGTLMGTSIVASAEGENQSTDNTIIEGATQTYTKVANSTNAAATELTCTKLGTIDDDTTSLAAGMLNSIPSSVTQTESFYVFDATGNQNKVKINLPANITGGDPDGSNNSITIAEDDITIQDNMVTLEASGTSSANTYYKIEVKIEIAGTTLADGLKAVAAVTKVNAPVDPVANAYADSLNLSSASLGVDVKTAETESAITITKYSQDATIDGSTNRAYWDANKVLHKYPVADITGKTKNDIVDLGVSIGENTKFALPTGKKFKTNANALLEGYVRTSPVYYVISQDTAANDYDFYEDKYTNENTIDVTNLYNKETTLDKNDIKYIINNSTFSSLAVTVNGVSVGADQALNLAEIAENAQIEGNKVVVKNNGSNFNFTVSESSVDDGTVWVEKDGEYVNNFEELTAANEYNSDLCKVYGTTEYSSLKQGDQFMVTYVEHDYGTNKDVVKEDIIKTVSDGTGTEYGYKATLNVNNYGGSSVILRYVGTTELKTGDVVTGTQFNFRAEDVNEYCSVASLTPNYFFTNLYDGNVTSNAEVKDAVKIEANKDYNVYFKKDVEAAGNGTLLTKDTKTNTYLISRSENNLADNEIYFVSNVVEPEKDKQTNAVTKAGSVTISVMKFDMISSDLISNGDTFTQNDIIYINTADDTFKVGENTVNGISALTINNSAAYDKYLGTANPDYGKNLLGKTENKLNTINLVEGNLYTMKKIASDNKLTAFPADALFTLNDGVIDENEEANTNFIEVSSKYNAIDSADLINNYAVNKFDKIINSEAANQNKKEGGPDVTIVIKGFGDSDITQTLKSGGYYKTDKDGNFVDKDGNVILDASDKPITDPTSNKNAVYIVPESFMIDVDITAPECLRVQSVATATDGSKTYTFVKSTYNTCGADTAKDTCVWAFDEATGTLSITGEGAIASYSAASEQPWKDNKSKITKVVIGEGVTEIGAYNFAGLNKVTAVELPSTLKKIGANAFDGANLTYTKANPLVISASVNEIGANAFANNKTLGFVKFEEKKTSSLVSVSYAVNMFAGSFNATATTETPVTPLIISYYAGTDIADTLTSTPVVPEAEKDIKGQIYKSLISVLSEKGNCGSKATWALMSDGTLTIGGEGEVDTAEWDTIDTTIKITKLVVEEGITALNVPMNLSEVTSVELPESLTTLGRSCFEGAKIASIDLKNVTEIADSAFRDCTSLTSVTSDKLVKIGANAFLGCTGLASITLPVDLESIGAKAFQNTNNGGNFTINGYVGVASDYASKYEYVKFNNISKFASGQLTIASKLELKLTFANIDVKDATFDPNKNEASAAFKVYVNDEEVTVANNVYKKDIAPKDAKTPVKWEVKKAVTMKNGSVVETSVESGEYSVQDYLDGYLSYDLDNTSDVEALLVANGVDTGDETAVKTFIEQFKKDKALINSLDEYCAATAGYFGTGSKFVADEAFEEAYTKAVSETKDENGKTVKPIIETINKFNNGTSVSDISNLAKQGVSLYGTSLILKDTITVRAYVKFAADSPLLAFIPEDGDLKFAKELADGSKLYYQDSEAFTADKYNTLKDLDVVIKTDDKAAKITFKLQVAPLAYAEKVINAASNADNTDLVNVCKALVNLVAQVELRKQP